MRRAKQAHILRNKDLFFGLLLEAVPGRKYLLGVEQPHYDFKPGITPHYVVESCRLGLIERDLTFERVTVEEPHVDSRRWEWTIDVQFLGFNHELPPAAVVQQYCMRDGEEDLVAAWSATGFALAAYMPQSVEQLTILRDAIVSGDSTLWIQPPNSASGWPGGLVLAILSRMPISVRGDILAVGHAR